MLKKIIALFLLLFAQHQVSCNQPKILLITGSARVGNHSAKIAQAMQQLLDKKNVNLEIMYVQTCKLPFFNIDKNIVDADVSALKHKIIAADALIFLCPTYNSGYSGILKNCIDSIGYELFAKPVGLIGYSGGADGGKASVKGLIPVLELLQAHIFYKNIIFISSVESALINHTFKNKSLENQIMALVNTIYNFVSI